MERKSHSPSPTRRRRKARYVKARLISNGPEIFAYARTHTVKDTCEKFQISPDCLRRNRVAWGDAWEHERNSGAIAQGGATPPTAKAHGESGENQPKERATESLTAPRALEPSQKCPACASLGIDHDQMLRRCLEDFYTCCRFLCGFKDMTKKFHGRICHELQQGIEHGETKFLVVLHRGSLKTHMLSIGFPIWQLIRDANTRVAIFQTSGKKATNIIKVISTILQSEQFRHFFGHLIPDRRDRWNMNEIEINHTMAFPEANISARGIGSRVVGDHYNIIIPDDIVDLLDADSEATMGDAVSWLKHHTPLFVDPSKGITIVAGTRWSEDDPYGYIKQNLPMYHVIEAGCFVDERCAKMGFNEPGESVWPERFSKSVLDGIKAEINDDWVWSHQYLNVAISDELRRFREPFPEYTWEVPGESLLVEGRRIEVDDLFRVLTLDPSVGESRDADDSAFVVTGYERKSGNVYVLDTWAQRAMAPTIIEKLVELQQEWEPHITGIEAQGFQITLKYPLRQLMGWKERHFAITELQAKNIAKPKRIEGLVPYFSNKQVYVHKTMAKLRKQLVAFHPGSTGHDDLIDALAYHIPYWRGRPGRLSLVPGIEDEDIEDRHDERPPAYGLACAT